MVAQTRDVIADVVRCHHDVALSREHGRDQGALRIARIDVGDVKEFVGLRGMRKQHDGARARAGRCRSGRHHQGTGSQRGFARTADRPVLKIVKVHAQAGRSGHLQQLRARRAGAKG